MAIDFPIPQPPAMPTTGRPRALDEVKRREVCALISAGCGVEGAARFVGCAANYDFDEPPW